MLAATIGLAGPAAARDSLGVFSEWGAFRDADPARCFAIAEPAIRVGPNAAWRPFASIGFWPGRARGAQINIRLSRPRRADAPVVLILGDRRYTLVASRSDAWTTDRRMDAAIVAQMRSEATMLIATRSERGRLFTDEYPLRGAATAIDAAAIGCARVR